MDSAHICITSKTALKKGVTYKLRVHSNSIKDDTGNGLSKAHVKPLSSKQIQLFFIFFVH